MMLRSSITKVRFLVLLVFEANAVLHGFEEADNVRNITFQPPMENIMLNLGHVIANTTVDNLEECQMSCFLYPNCSAINFNTNLSEYRNNCRLSTSGNVHTGLLIPVPGYIFQDSKNFCFKDACNSINMVCQSGYGSRGYRCTCAPCFTGRNCTQNTYNVTILNFPHRSTDQHVELKNAFGSKDYPISMFTIAMWIQMIKTDQKLVRTPFSFVDNTNKNQIAILIKNEDKLEVTFKGKDSDVDYPSSELFDGTWHHIALTWKERTVRLYINGITVKTWHSNNDIRPFKKKLRFALGQELDSFGGDGGYDLDQSFIGNITGFNMWSTEFKKKKIESLANECPSRQEGDLLAWSKLVPLRSINLQVYCGLPCGKGST